MFCTANGGNRWQKLFLRPENLTSVYWISERTGMVVTEYRQIYKTINGGGITIVFSENQNVARGFELFKNFPNPFNSRTFIPFSIPAASDVTLRLYNVLGREVTTLMNGRIEGGFHSVVWDAVGVSSGIYFCRLRAGNRTSTIKVVVNK